MTTEPILKKSILSQIISEGAVYGPLQLKDYIVSEAAPLTFQAELDNGEPLPTGLICTSDGMINGIPATNTHGQYRIKITAKNAEQESLQTEFILTIKERLVLANNEEINELKTKVWEALKDNLPLPEISDIFNREISAVEIYYLLQRFAVLTIWDVYNLDAPGEKKLLQLPSISKYYNIYDRGSCLVGAPKDLFDHNRTLGDALQTARAMAEEAFNRNWTVELSGFNKMIRAAWVELQHLSDKHNRVVDILHFNPSSEDVRIYTEQSRARVANELGL